MKTAQVIKELIGDYPRLWEFMDAQPPHQEGSAKFARRYPLSIAVLSTALEFNRWVIQTSRLVEEVAGIPCPRNIPTSNSGPDTMVIARLNWLSKSWDALESRDKDLAKTLDKEVDYWTMKIRARFQGATSYKYLSGATCQYCSSRSVVKYENSLMCINQECRDPMTGEWRTWQV